MEPNNREPELQEQIIVLKTTNTNGDVVIQHQIYASAGKASKNFQKFVLIGDNDAIGIRVLAMGDISQPSGRTTQSQVPIIFNSDQQGNWIWEYILSNIVDLRSQYLTIEDVFLSSDVGYVKHTEQFSYVDGLKYDFNTESII